MQYHFLTPLPTPLLLQMGYYKIDIIFASVFAIGSELQVSAVRHRNRPVPSYHQKQTICVQLSYNLRVHHHNGIVQRCHCQSREIAASATLGKATCPQCHAAFASYYY